MGDKHKVPGSIKEAIEWTEANDPAYIHISFALFQTELSFQQFALLAKGLQTNTHITEVDLQKLGMTDEDVKEFLPVIQLNKTITHLDLGYNKITQAGIILLAGVLTENSTLQEVKLHRQSHEMGALAEDEVIKIWDKNTHLQRLYATLHNRRCNQANTRGEVRNKEIARRRLEGRDWSELDPASQSEVAKRKHEERLREQEELEKSRAPISEKKFHQLEVLTH